jgi:hypothetical protein
VFELFMNWWGQINVKHLPAPDKEQKNRISARNIR